MKKIVKKMAVIIVAFTALILCSCEKKSDYQIDKYSTFQAGFSRPLGNEMIESPDGFYLLSDEFLTFFDKKLENPVLVCDRVECRHNEEDKEHMLECNAFYSNPQDIKYYNDHLYIAANAMLNEPAVSIYETDLDGNNKKVLYTQKNPGEFIFLIYKGDLIICEQEYKDDNILTTLIRFPMYDRDQITTIFTSEDTRVKDSHINYMVNDGETLYFTFINKENSLDTSFYAIDLKTNEIKQLCKEINLSLDIGRDRLIGTENIENDNERMTWKNKLYQYSKDGTIEKEITEEDYAALSQGASLSGMDNEYVYLSDICYGANALPKEDRYHYIYTYEGKEAGKIRQTGTSSWYFYPGNEEYVVISDWLSNTEKVFYKVDKTKFVEEKPIELKEFYRYDRMEFSS